jgi:hypothetical protein
VQGIWWKLPVLRGLSPMRRGLVEAAWVTLVASLLLLPVVHAYGDGPSGDLLTSIAQVGATLLVAYGVEISWFLRESRARGANRENWVGKCAGVGSSGLLGIGLALALSGNDGTLTLFEQFVFTWSIVSIALLGLLVALVPFEVHEWAHAVHTEYPDE